MSHTPGPWIMEGHFVFGPTHELSRHPNGRVLVAEVIRGSHRADPQLNGGANHFSFDSLHDARLIAAAPEMLECLEHIQGIVSESQGVAGWHQNGQVASWDELGLREEIDGVLAKAGGEESE